MGKTQKEMGVGRKVIKIILIIIGTILLIWFLLPFFTYRIMNIGNMTGIGVSLVLLLYGIFFNPVNRFITVLWRTGVGRVIEIIVGAAILAILVLAALCMICMGRGMTAGSVQRTETATRENLPETEGGQGSSVQMGADKSNHPDIQPRTVIVLGCKTIGDQPSLMLAERLETAYEYLIAHPEARAIVSGGLGEDETTAEAEVMFHWLVERGIAPERILQENQSTDTHENLANCYGLIQSMDADYWVTDVMLATNEFHEYRALKIAREAGFDAEPLPAATAWWLFPTYYVREMYGILEDWFLV